ncbi:MAG: heme-binding protein [Deltaproteobacteria bacterium]
MVIINRRRNFRCCSLVFIFSILIGLYGCSAQDTEGGLGPNPGDPSFDTEDPLTSADVRLIIQRAATEAVRLNTPVTITVVDRGGNVLGAFRMNGAPETTLIGSQDPDRIQAAPFADRGLELFRVRSDLAAISKAGAAAFLSTSGNAFTPLTASDIIQEHRPVGINFTASGPLFGVQFSSLPCTDIKNNPPLPLGLAGDPGGIPLYKNGDLAGAIGVEGALEAVVIGGVEMQTARYTIDTNPNGEGAPAEELIAVAGSFGFEAPDIIRADRILLDGLTLPYTKSSGNPSAPESLIPFFSLPGSVVDIRITGLGGVPDTVFFDGAIRNTPDPNYGFRSATIGGIPGRIAVDAAGNNRFPFRASASGGLSAREVQTILENAIARAFSLRAAIRQPSGNFVEVNVFVVDENGAALGYFGTPDAPFFGFDVSMQKARLAAFASNSRAASELRRVGLGNFVDSGIADGIFLDGSIAFSNRAFGFLNRPFFPDDIDGTEAGPYSRDISIWSPFNVGLQLSLVAGSVLRVLSGQEALGRGCAGIAGLESGIQIFAGSVPLYKNGRLVGAVGVSGDGIDQDDFVAFSGSEGFEAPEEIRSDSAFVRQVRLPFVRLPRNPFR